MNNKEIKDIGKVWDIIRNNEKNYRKKNKANVVYYTKPVKRKIIPLFIDDDNVVIEREKIINMHNVFMKETNNEYTNSHMNNVFNMLFENKKNYSVRRYNLNNSPKELKTSSDLLPSINTKISYNTNSNKFIFNTSNIKVEKKEDNIFDSFDSEIEEKARSGNFNRNKLVCRLRKEFPFFNHKTMKNSDSKITREIDRMFNLSKYQNNVEVLLRTRKKPELYKKRNLYNNQKTSTGFYEINEYKNKKFFSKDNIKNHNLTEVHRNKYINYFKDSTNKKV